MPTSAQGEGRVGPAVELLLVLDEVEGSFGVHAHAEDGPYCTAQMTLNDAKRLLQYVGKTGQLLDGDVPVHATIKVVSVTPQRGFENAADSPGGGSATLMCSLESAEE